MIHWNDFASWLFYGVMGGCSVYGVSILSGLKCSVDSLNIKVATLLERTATHERRIEKLENKVQ